MTCVVVNDASCLIDFGKGGLLPYLCRLPYEFILPLPVRKSEVLNFSDDDWHALDSAGMLTYDLSPEEVEAAFSVKRRYPALSANDCFCFVTSRTRDAILLTGDAQLTRAARRNGLRVHGVLWAIDQLKQENTCADALLVDALNTWLQDKSVFLPSHEILGRLSLLAPQSSTTLSSDVGSGEVRDRPAAGFIEYG